MPIWHALLFGIVEGLTEFLPISSTGHLTVVERLLGYQIDRPDITAFTAIIQVGAVLATIMYLRKDIVRIVGGWFRGLINPAERGAGYRFGWAVIYGSIPIGIVGILFQPQIETTLRSLWIVGGTLIAFSAVMLFADRVGTQNRHENDVSWKDTIVIGVVQCLALVPGVSRSGATMSAGLLRGLDRVAVTKLSFFLAIPALAAAGILQTAQQYDAGRHRGVVRRRLCVGGLAAEVHRPAHLHIVRDLSSTGRRRGAGTGRLRRHPRHLTRVSHGAARGFGAAGCIARPPLCCGYYVGERVPIGGCLQ